MDSDPEDFEYSEDSEDFENFEYFGDSEDSEDYSKLSPIAPVLDLDSTAPKTDYTLEEIAKVGASLKVKDFNSSMDKILKQNGISSRTSNLKNLDMKKNVNMWSSKTDICVKKGDLLMEEASKYFGDTVKVITYESGGVYRGEVNRQGESHGKGVYNYGDGKRVYRGEFEFGKKHGIGKINWSDKNYYIGEFKDDRINGKGLKVYENGNIYYGDFVQNQKCGEGVFKWPRGYVYIGQFRNNKVEGKGYQFFPDGSKFESEMHFIKFNSYPSKHDLHWLAENWQVLQKASAEHGLHTPVAIPKNVSIK